MSALRYRSGEPVEAGDSIRYCGDPARVDFVVPAVGYDPAYDWYAKSFPGGGAMVTASAIGSVYVEAEDIAEELELVSKGPRP
jgi:hypothetical protein